MPRLSVSYEQLGLGDHVGKECEITRVGQEFQFRTVLSSKTGIMMLYLKHLQRAQPPHWMESCNETGKIGGDM